MKKFYLIAVILISLSGFAKQIDQETAQRAAVNFLKQASSISQAGSVNQGNPSLMLVYPGVKSRNNARSSGQDNAPYYIFDIDHTGFIIIANEDASLPVLGYSFESAFDESKISPEFRKWLETYKKQIRFIRSNDIKPTPEVFQKWEELKSGSNTVNYQSARSAAIAPLIETKWNQSPFVNDLCPYDNDYQELTVTGCPATAMAQIMKYWEYPAKGSGFHSYNHEKYGTLSANFSSTYYDWSAMPNAVTSSNSEVATLMYHCGVAVEMQYNVAAEGGSGSYVITYPNAPYSENQTVQHALTTYFGYDNSTIQGLFREDYSDTEWKNKLKGELDAGRPVQYAGFGQGGHTFVCDGYDNNDFFHMNWGWGGQFDGYFLLDALSPGTGGIGSGAGNFNENQQALIGIKPPDGSLSYGLEIYADVITNKSVIAYGESFVITTDILNDGGTEFNGDFSAAVFDENDVFIDFVEILSGMSLSPGFHYTSGISFTTDGLLTILPGMYKVYIFYRPTDGNWVGLKSDNSDLTTADYTTIEVVNENELSLYSTIDVTPEDIYSGGSISVWLDVANFSASDFTGILDVSLYNFNGEFVATIEEKTGIALASNNHFINGLTFTSDNLDVEPGTYLLALLHKKDGFDYEITGSTSSFINPIQIIVKTPPVVKDIYEDNDEIDVAYPLIANFINDQSGIKTTGANFHVGSDWDFYSIDLESGFEYSIDIRLHDSYNSGDGNTYTVDGLFLYSLDGENWSETYDDLMPDAVVSYENPILYVVVSPYFLGERGTYLLDINLQRTKVLAIDDERENSNFLIYPNPASGAVFINAGISDEVIDQLAIFNQQGQVVLMKNNYVNQSAINVSQIPAGLYMVRLKADSIIETKKLIVE